MAIKTVIFGVFCCLSTIGVQSLPAEFTQYWRNPFGSDAQTNSTNGVFPNIETDEYSSTVLFYLYTTSNVDTVKQLWVGNVSALNSSHFSASRSKTLILTHGFWDEVDSAFDSNFKNALLKYEDCNVIAIDWSYYTKNINYLYVVQKTEPVGTYIGEFIEFLMQQTGLSSDQLHLIGHSIGAHASGFAAKYLKKSGRFVARISGLDPAYPGFYTASSDGRLSSTDAKFVDCIHSCGGTLGYPTAICHADFFPNGGKSQPGCPWLDFGVCSHGRSFDYYAESINLTHKFLSQTCNSIVDGVPYNCKNEGALMGYPASPEFLGEFYLTTKSSSPFAETITTEE